MKFDEENACAPFAMWHNWVVSKLQEAALSNYTITQNETAT